MKTNSNELLQELELITQSNIAAAKSFLHLSESQLNHKASPETWSILECLEHLNRYSAFYLPEIGRHLAASSTTPQPQFKSGFMGNYLVNMVIPKEGGKKMKTFTAMNPSGSSLGSGVIDTFLNSQEKMLALLVQSKSNDLNKAGVAVTFTKLIRLKTGDALRFMAYHNQRHIQQALRVQT
ncbi:DinB family protein [Flavobacterium sp. MFBS3-15]|uniref:DinB family protein n=1 Tax=Flavobacterium sp. MFBS3-15 TaxID=2989816 RepID=UPI0022365480|nr:DinB family protein [Flavobacterium sp. MFBS3-15]MCW4467559.1 DinB family protein [Flavobacterium sp. MFBS3-15]